MLWDKITLLVNNIVAQNSRWFHLDILFYWDGAPPHYLRGTRKNLDVTHPDRWIGGREQIKWQIEVYTTSLFYMGYVKF